jgi:hypothetical protein
VGLHLCQGGDKSHHKLQPWFGVRHESRIDLVDPCVAGKWRGLETHICLGIWFIRLSKFHTSYILHFMHSDCIPYVSRRSKANLEH